MGNNIFSNDILIIVTLIAACIFNTSSEDVIRNLYLNEGMSIYFIHIDKFITYQANKDSV
jgi:hypothetical protein